MNQIHKPQYEGILLIDKPKSMGSFVLVSILRRLLGIRTIGHAGTLDPFATGLMVLLIGRPYTKLSDTFLTANKEYATRLLLGSATDTHDLDGQVTSTSDKVPTLQEVESAIAHFQGEIEQTPPMFSAKKVNGQKLCDLARKGKVVERKAAKVHVETQLIGYEYPYVDIYVKCSKGTYIRSIGHEIGLQLGTGAHLIDLRRMSSGNFHVNDCIDGQALQNGLYLPSYIQQHLKKTV